MDENKPEILDKIKSIELGIDVEMPEVYAAKGIVTTLEDLSWLPGMRSGAGNPFWPNRLVANISFFDVVNNQLLVPPFNPRIPLRVYYTHHDLKHALRLKLAFWDAAGVRWVLFNGEKHLLVDTRINNQIYAGYFQIELENWADPPIALGE